MEEKETLNNKYSGVIEYLKVIIITIVVVMAIRIFVFSIANVEGQSMQTTLMNNDKLIMEKISQKLKILERGDIIAFKSSGIVNPSYADDKDIYIKRIIGISGDTVELKDDGVYLNDKKLNEPYLQPNLQTRAEKYLPMNKKITVDKDTFFVLGDNRPFSGDSREFGLVSQNAVIGQAVFRIFPLNKIGKI